MDMKSAAMLVCDITGWKSKAIPDDAVDCCVMWRPVLVPGLAKAALAGKVDGKLVDTSYLIEQDAAISIITEKDPEALGSYSSFNCSFISASG